METNLVLNKDYYQSKDQAYSVYSSIDGMGEGSGGKMPWESSAVANGLGGGQPIFGTYHDMTYKSPYER